MNSDYLNDNVTTFGTIDYGSTSAQEETTDLTMDKHIKDPTDLVQQISYGITWIRFLFIPLICGGNLMTILVIWKNEHMRTNTNVFIVSLAVVDLCVGTFFLPISSLQLIYGDEMYLNKLYSLFMKGPYFYIIYLQLSNLLVIAIDRFIAILYPFRYTIVVTRQTVTFAVISMWVLPLPGPICYMIFWNT